jgi:hypothetical protein
MLGGFFSWRNNVHTYPLGKPSFATYLRSKEGDKFHINPSNVE